MKTDLRLREEVLGLLRGLPCPLAVTLALHSEVDGNLIVVLIVSVAFTAVVAAEQPGGGVAHRDV